MNSDFVRIIIFIAAVFFAYAFWKAQPRKDGAAGPPVAVPAAGEAGSPPAVPVAGEMQSPPVMQRTPLPPTYVVDLESGRVVDADPAALDLWWQAKTETERCLCPYVQGGALLARIPPGAFDYLDAAKLGALDYSTEGFADTDASPGVQRGMELAVRTVEGNFAKVRVVDVEGSKRLILEWKLYRPATSANAAPPRLNASVEIPRLLEAAKLPLRAKDKAATIALVQQAAVLVDGMPKGSARRIELLNDIGSMYWSASYMSIDSADVFALAETTFLTAVDEMHAPANWDSELGPLRKEIDPELAGRIYRMLGVLYRDRSGYVRDTSFMVKAVPWFKRAVAIAEGLPQNDARQKIHRAFKMVSELNELADAQCQTGEPEIALANEARIKQICVETNGAGSAGVCQDQYRGCKPWMTQVPKAPAPANSAKPAP